MNRFHGCVMAGSRDELCAQAHFTAMMFFGHENFTITIEEAEVEGAVRNLGGQVVSVLFSADFTAEETPTARREIPDLTGEVQFP